MKPPGDIEWEQSVAPIGGSSRETYVMRSADGVLARKFVGEYWSWAYSQRAALFVNHPPKVQGEPVGITPDGFPVYRPTAPPAEIWFIPEILFREAWAFARVRGFTSSECPPAVVEACDAFLVELASRHPIGVEAVGQGWAEFRRYGDGGGLELRDMRRAWELNMEMLGGRQDTLHMDPRTPQQFVANGRFHFGL